jgi:hypothetical protein
VLERADPVDHSRRAAHTDDDSFLHPLEPSLIASV